MLGYGEVMVRTGGHYIMLGYGEDRWALHHVRVW